MKLLSIIRKFGKCRRGATYVEYGLLATGVALAIASAINTMSDNMKTTVTGTTPTFSSDATEQNLRATCVPSGQNCYPLKTSEGGGYGGHGYMDN